MARCVLVGFALMLADPTELPFPLRTNPPPREWKLDEINNGLPYRWQKGTVYVLAWEITEDVGDNTCSQTTQILVLKRFNQPTEDGFRWVLAHLYHRPKDKERPWRREMLHYPSGASRRKSAEANGCSGVRP
jgi:hypothetical protein